MKTFQDNLGETWTLRIDVDAMRRVQAHTTVNLTMIDRPRQGSDLPLFTEVATDLLMLANIVFAIIQPQAESKGLSDSDLAKRFEGGVIRRAEEAFYSEWLDFFRQEGRTDAVATLEKNREIMTSAGQHKAKLIERLDVEDLTTTAFSGSVTSVPELLESIQDHSPSVN